MARRGRGQFQFTIVELTVLAVSFTVTSVLVFLLGLYVGREFAAQHAPVDERVARVRVTDPSQPETRKAEPDPATLAPLFDSDQAVQQPVTPGEPPAPPVPPRVLDESSQPPQAASPEPAVPGGLPRPELAPPATEEPEPAVSSRPSEQDRVVAVEKEPPEPSTPPAESELASSTERRATRSVTYTVQVLATRNRTEADALVEDLKAHDLGAFVAAVEDAGGRWYRVRIGRFDEPRSARTMVERCKRELGLGQAYVSPY